MRFRNLAEKRGTVKKGIRNSNHQHGMINHPEDAGVVCVPVGVTHSPTVALKACSAGRKSDLLLEN